ncbi:S-adenosyl-L-methionine-dependent methyltransferase [Marasmius fiardii PR-910]|nr:S-adenosyl-L-methionine-dependent methyltransferase [Marasmius fiardii PR-910]
MSSPLSALVDIISKGVASIESSYKKENLDFPSLDEPFSPGLLDNNAALVMTVRTVIAASLQLVATIRPPMETLQDISSGMYLPATLGTVNEAHVANALTDSGSQGMAVRDISRQVGIESGPLARVLRFLATRHVFKEVKPNVFANNRISSLLVKSSSVAEIRKNPNSQYGGSPVAALVGHFTDEAFRSSLSIPAYLLGGYKDASSPFGMAMDTEATVWEWYERPENAMRVHRFNIAMKGVGDRFPPSIYTDAFDWGSLGNDAVVVDVGGGVGPVTLGLHTAFPQIQYIVQDLHPVINDAKKFWETEAPDALTSGNVKLEVHNFFKPQPVKNATVYFMRVVLHDWSQSMSEKIMTAIRQAADSNSKLIVFDLLASHACAEVPPILGSPIGPPPPPPLLANFMTGALITMVDMQMLNLMNGMERTVGDFVELGNASGWKLESVKPGPLATLIFSAS